jgi:hypothetical protein
MALDHAPVYIRRQWNEKKIGTVERLLEIVGPRPKWKMGEHWP